MRKLSKLLMIVGMASLVTFTACKKDDETDPTIADVSIKITPSPTGDLEVGDELTLTIQGTGNDDNKLKSITVSSSVKTDLLLDKTLTGTTATEVITETMTAAGSVTYTVTLEGEKGKKTATYTVNVTAPAGPSFEYQYITLDLGNQVNATLKPFWAGANDNQTYRLSDAVGNTTLQNQIDFCYLTRNAGAGGNKLASPNSGDATDIYGTQWSAAAEKITEWAKRRNTMFIEVTAVSQNDFNQTIAGDSTAKANLIATARNAGEPAHFFASVADAKIYLFKTEDGHYGLVNVSSPTGEVVSGSPTSGSVNLGIIYQKKLN